jgi:hypothetical protein
MVEGQGLDDPVLLDRGLADDGSGALHVTKPVACWIRGDRPIAVPPLRSPERGRRKPRAGSDRTNRAEQRARPLLRQRTRPARPLKIDIKSISCTHKSARGKLAA